MLEITPTAPIGTNQADFVIPDPGNMSAFWTDETNGKSYRATRMNIADNGMAWVFSVRVTRRLVDYKSGEGMWLVLREGASPIGAGWNAVTGDLAVALLNAGWNQATEMGSARFPAFIWSRPGAPSVDVQKATDDLADFLRSDALDQPRRDPWAPQTYTEVLKARDDAAARIADMADERDALQRRIVALEDQVVGYQQSLAEANQRIAELGQAGAALTLEKERAQGNWGRNPAGMVRNALAGEVALGLGITADHVQEADRLLLVDGFPVGYQQANGEVEPGLLVEHRQIHPRWSDCVEITVWFGGQMVSLAMDAGTKVQVRRPV